MIKNSIPCSSAPDFNSNRSFNPAASNKSGFLLLLCAALCLVTGATSAQANTKKEKSARASSNKARVEKRKAEKPLSKREVAASRRDNKRESLSRRENFSRRETTSKRDLLMTRESAVKRASVNKTTIPSVRKTAIVNAPLPNKSNATRSALVNDIVIISEAKDVPVTSSLPVQPKTSAYAANSNMPSIWPVAGTFGKSGFGFRRNPFGGSGTEFHKGQDISAPYGASVIATADGTVVIAGWLRGYGNVVYIDHGNGISTRYGHLSRIDVIVGQTVKRGEQLGLVGSTGRSTGPHLHYEVRLDGQATNPVPYLPELPSPILANKPGIQ
ncbi:MAG: M23 family metallopeptidase [Acidobacteria bacterium]|nr:M23 family metallopeptidase [Acidobacteriota bacterium]